MQAKPGDRVVIEGLKVGDSRRRGEIVEVLHGRAGDHFRVRWERDDHESIFYPGPDTFLEPGKPTKRSKSARSGAPAAPKVGPPGYKT